MLDWLGNRHAMPPLCEAAEALDRAVDVAYAEKIKPFEFGGSDGTREIARAVWESIA